MFNHTLGYHGPSKLTHKVNLPRVASETLSADDFESQDLQGPWLSPESLCWGFAVAHRPLPGIEQKLSLSLSPPKHYSLKTLAPYKQELNSNKCFCKWPDSNRWPGKMWHLSPGTFLRGCKPSVLLGLVWAPTSLCGNGARCSLEIFSWSRIWWHWPFTSSESTAVEFIQVI